MEIALLVIFVALVFTCTNGFHDTANAIVTVVGTKVLTPRQAIMLAAVTNLFGAFFGLAVAKTISSGLVDAKFVPSHPCVRPHRRHRLEFAHLVLPPAQQFESRSCRQFARRCFGRRRVHECR